jgi:hypothetical protein
MWQGIYVMKNKNKKLHLPSPIKGSRQRERRGFGNVSNGPNLSRTAAIDVLFSINFAVVFYFMYFRFRQGGVRQELRKDKYRAKS